MSRLLPAPAHEVEAALSPWRRIVAGADAFFGRVFAAHKDSMRCGPGCTSCCHPDLTVLPSEALAILLGLGRLDPAPLRRLRRAGRADRCVLLGADELCSVYAERPLVCRSHGLPILQETEVGWCSLNFLDGAPPQSAVLDGNLLAAQLAVADSLVYARGESGPTARGVCLARSDRTPGEAPRLARPRRVAIRDLLRLGADALPPLPPLPPPGHPGRVRTPVIR